MLYVLSRESRYFSSWRRGNAVDTYQLPISLQEQIRQKTCSFGDCALSFADDCTIGVETCEELFTPQAPHIRLALSGVDIISNGSGSHHQASPPSLFPQLLSFSPCITDTETIMMHLSARIETCQSIKGRYCSHSASCSGYAGAWSVIGCPDPSTAGSSDPGWNGSTGKR